ISDAIRDGEYAFLISGKNKSAAIAALLEALFSQGNNTECQACDCRGATSNRTCCFPVILGSALR
ncbi:hypothetical protein, partial [Kocuria sabuli]|uniref:hypothetical protein n=1 Tax=Kocuria sabuli TaxID=3071448 RepID=UPI0034D3DA71